MRLLGIDLGTKRVGVAITDELGFGAYPVATFLRGRSRADDLATLLRFVEQQQAEAIVMGLPLNADGSKGEWAERVEKFTAALAEVSPVPVHLHNEYLSSQEAAEDLIAAGVKAKRRQQVIDQAAAVRILESYLRLEPSPASYPSAPSSPDRSQAHWEEGLNRNTLSILLPNEERVQGEEGRRLSGGEMGQRRGEMAVGEGEV